MESKGFEIETLTNQTPDTENNFNKPLKSDDEENIMIKRRVDINVLKSRIQQEQNKEKKQNLTIFILFLTILGSLGIYLSI